MAEKSHLNSAGISARLRTDDAAAKEVVAAAQAHAAHKRRMEVFKAGADVSVRR
jgi:hypothetical protein